MGTTIPNKQDLLKDVLVHTQQGIPATIPEADPALLTRYIALRNF